MQYKINKIFLSFVIFFCLIIISGCDKNITNEKLFKLQKQGIQKIIINNNEIQVEIVADVKSRHHGLSERESLCENCGMFFVFDNKGLYDFWMKDMRFPLDIIYIDGNRIVEIFKNVQILENEKITTISPKKEADRVLEINAGFSDKLGIKEGQILKFD